MHLSEYIALMSAATIAKDWHYAIREGYRSLVKWNVSAYRATRPKDIPADHWNVVPNWLWLTDMAASAALIIVCHGRLPLFMQPGALHLANLLRPHMDRTFCFGLNADGSPKHPLYLPNDTPLIPWRPAA